MPRRHPHTYRRPNRSDETIADAERAVERPENASVRPAPRRDLPSLDCRPILAVIAVVIFGLGLIAFLLSLRMK
jgi:hypothetical protein